MQFLKRMNEKGSYQGFNSASLFPRTARRRIIGVADVRDFHEMYWLRNFDTKVRRCSIWSQIFVLAVVCSLAVNVATRYSVSTSSHTGISAKRVTSHSRDQKRQHLDETATTLIEPDSRLLAVLQVSNFYPRFAPGGPPVHNLLLDTSLYNRPPPSSQFLS
jgi:hypothetical protein